MCENILFWNCVSGIKSKIDYLKAFIVDKNFKLLFISESETSENDASIISIKGYDIITPKRQGKTRILCYALSTLQYTIVKLDSIFEIFALDVGNERIIGVYRPFKLPTNFNKCSHLNGFIKSLTKLCSTNNKLTIGGDFNIDLNKPSHELNLIENCAFTSGLSQLVEKNQITRSRIVNTPNRVRIEASALDHITQARQIRKLN
jgi:hypothetical protein